MTQDFSAVLLLGGKSSRMGRDKAFIAVDGIPLWQRQLRILTTLAPAEIFLAGPPRPEWNGAGCTIIPDAQENAGPLAGLVSGLRRSSTTLLLALAVDLPDMTSDYLRRLHGLCERDRGVVPVTDRFEPLAAFYPIRSLPIAEQFLSTGRHAVQDFARRCVEDGLLLEEPIRPADSALFLNMNTPADVAAARR